MAYDEELADRIRETVEGEAGMTEKRMFGGLAFLVDGKMAVAASSHGGLMLRVDPAGSDALAGHDHVSPMVMRGRELDGWVRVDAGALTDDADLHRWVTSGISYARSLPARD
jgi:TfoX/Sxy family transcriptional regulator of competence genes